MPKRVPWMRTYPIELCVEALDIAERSRFILGDESDVQDYRIRHRFDQYSDGNRPEESRCQCLLVLGQALKLRPTRCLSASTFGRHTSGQSTRHYNLAGRSTCTDRRNKT